MPDVIKVKSVTALTARIDEVISKTSAEHEELMKRLSAAEEAEKAAADKMDAALLAGDIDAYKTADIAKSDADFEKRACNARLEAMQRRPLITKEEYEALTKSVKDEVTTLAAAAEKKILNHAKAIEAEGAQLRAAINAANEALGRLQSDLYRNKDRIETLPTGQTYMNSYTKNEIANDCWEPIRYCVYCTEENRYYQEAAKK